MRRQFVSLALIGLLFLIISAPVYAITLSTTYEMEGVISFRKQAGHECNTGGVMKQTISGSGKMDKIMTVKMVKGKLTVDDVNDWVAGATSLTVTSVWELCIPPKYTYDVEVFPGSFYAVPLGYPEPYVFSPHPAYWLGGDTTPSLAPGMVGLTVPMVADYYGLDALTEQVWAVQVQADPGFSGNLHQKGEAAYGGYRGTRDNDGADWLYSDSWGAHSDTWRYEIDKDGLRKVAVGKDFVGDYFTMEQHARTSQGTIRRFIDISSYWSHAYLMEDMSIVGKSSIKESVKLDNLPAGKDVPKDWWRLF